MGMAHGALGSIRIQNFRRFADLTIPRLGMANLIVGRNGTGKSSVLEAVRLLASDRPFEVLQDIYVRREEGFSGGLLEDFYALSCLIRRGTPTYEEFRISTGGHFVTGSIRTLQRVKDDDGGYRYEPILPGTAPDNVELVFEVTTPRGRRRYSTDEPRKVIGYRDHGHASKETGCVYIGTGGLTRHDITSLWGGIALTEMEDRINRCMRDSFPEIERISLIPGDRDSNIAAKVRGSDRPVSLKSIGEGASRLFGLALAAGNARNGVLLIDEVEIGMHYSIQIAVWRLLVQMALEFQVQIFATTHSEDAIRGFSIATKENEAVDGRLIRLQSRGGEIEAVEFDEEELVGVRDSGREIR
jgi:hypothetical protein